MKKFLIVVCLLLTGLKSHAAFMFETVGDMNHFWDVNGRFQQKVLDVGNKILETNKIDKRLTITVVMDFKTINADASPDRKNINVYTGILPYIDNDDELAYLIGHETGHILDYYDGFLKWFIVMQLNKKEYEYKADLIGIDLMAKAGYNPVASICAANKFLDESYWDDYFFWSHPRGSKRLLAMYKYIFKKYPWALKTDMVNNIHYKNFLNCAQKDIDEFQQTEQIRADKRRGESL